jgi:hypothetical protein
MQPPADPTVVRAFPKIWGAYLRYQLQTDERGLDRTLPCRPDGNPFEFGRHPRPLPTRLAPRVFRRILEEGHWPDISSYGEPDSGGTFNLWQRVGAHLPGSQDWLFRDLKRIAQGQPLDEAGIQASIQNVLDRFGSTRLHPKASALIVAVDTNFDLEISASLFERQWEALSTFTEPLHVTLLTLLLQEWKCYWAEVPEALFERCLRAWTRLLRRPELAFDRAVQSAAIGACRRILSTICMERRVVASEPKGTWSRRNPLCSIWAPTADAITAEQRLCRFFDVVQHERMQVLRRGPLMSRPSIRALPADVERDIELVIDCVVTSRDGWAEWTPALKSSPAPEVSNSPVTVDRGIPA